MSEQSGNNTIRTIPKPNCYLCGTKGTSLYKGLVDGLFGASGEWNLSRCPNSECGLVWLDPTPVQEDVIKAYSNYYTHRKNDNQHRKNDTRKANYIKSLLRGTYNQLLKLTSIPHNRRRVNLMYLDKVRPGKLLEVGCGDGQRLAHLQLLGWSVEGQEIDPQAAAYIRRTYDFKVHLGNLKGIEFAEATFDTVIANHVIEHVQDPIGLLTECRRILKHKGTLVAITPNIESSGHRHFGMSWRGLEPPRHQYLYNLRTLHRIALCAGFSKYEIWTTPANAQTFAVGSFLGVQHVDIDKMVGYSRHSIHFKAILFQLWANFHHFYQNTSGEECVLRAIK